MKKIILLILIIGLLLFVAFEIYYFASSDQEKETTYEIYNQRSIGENAPQIPALPRG